MNTKERYEKYIQEYCSNCKNKDKFDCGIKVYQKGDAIVTKCECYERKDKAKTTKFKSKF